MTYLNRTNALGLVVVGASLMTPGCREDREQAQMPTTTATGGGTTGGLDDDDDGDDDSTLSERLDIGSGDSGNLPVGCGGDVDCELIDILFVIDNSATMGEEQLNLAANFPLLIERLSNLDGDDGTIKADVNIMVTTSDFGHPLCTDFNKPGYVPSQGSPVFSGCNQRISSFTSPHPFNPTEIPEACTQGCPADVVPGGDPFIHFDPMSSNVPMGDVAAALACVGPQGIEGCGYEAPLETMLQALRPEACWNDPSRPECEDDPAWGWVGRGFIRPGSTLAIAIITDEADCSVQAPTGFSWFTDSDNDEYWSLDPEAKAKLPSSAVCWNAGVDCVDDDDDGVYESCTPRDNEVLHPTSRYKDFLKYIQEELHNEVVMLGILGVPQVTEREEVPPYAPIKGGVDDVVYRDWNDGEYDGTAQGGDILPAEWAKGVTAEHKQWEFGVGPGCTGKTTIMVENDEGEMEEKEIFTGQAVPPVRIRDVCESLDIVDDVTGQVRKRCCIESICGADFSPAIDCLTGIIQESISPVG